MENMDTKGVHLHSRMVNVLGSEPPGLSGDTLLDIEAEFSGGHQKDPKGCQRPSAQLIYPFWGGSTTSPKKVLFLLAWAFEIRPFWGCQS